MNRCIICKDRTEDLRADTRVQWDLVCPEQGSLSWASPYSRNWALAQSLAFLVLMEWLAVLSRAWEAKAQVLGAVPDFSTTKDPGVDWCKAGYKE